MNLTRKNRSTSLLLTLFFGPLGLLYSSVVGGLILLIVAVASAPTFIGPVICWVLAMILGDHFTEKHNDNVEKLSRLLGDRHD